MKHLNAKLRRAPLAALLLTAAAVAAGGYLPSAEARELGEGLRGSDRLLELGDDRGGRRLRLFDDRRRN